MRGVGVVVFAALAVVGLAAGIFVAGSGASSAGLRATADSTATTHVSVTATDSTFRLSRRSAPEGTVIFTVTNKGKVSHDFKIGGKKTPLLAPGHSAGLRVAFSKKGPYPYRSTVSGQAAAGLKGVFAIVAGPAPPPPATTAPPPTTTGTAKTTVSVAMFDQGTTASGAPAFVLSQLKMPSGMITFVITSNFPAGCNFNLDGIRVGAMLTTGQSETWTVALAPGVYNYHSDVFPHVMKGTFTVTP